MSVQLRVLGFDELDVRTAYEVWRLRQDVFVVEQECPYPDLDGRDLEPGTRHVVLWRGDDVGGCVRLLEEADGTVRIGRVVLAATLRGQGLAEEMMQEALASAGERPTVLDAQSPLTGWYAGFGFTVDGPEFLEDGIPHRPMRREAGPPV
ncbi:GNAT family N-acetyltransferase [Nocardioides panacisoli]|uniref:GNAT family N-acetyltransferase n=1 Tax=Nocardioides panacisoli TaxID=627624 RepID=UPI001C6394CD|nr:GNAT family N-acetyltransferase [Nocardioides panacisoli]QYJ02829.1 GNAT family N-acetyltransferase [Nocardioides panacisoli]